MTALRLAVLCSIIRKEEKLLFSELRRRGVEFDRIDDRKLVFDMRQRRYDYDLVFERAINHSTQKVSLS